MAIITATIANARTSVRTVPFWRRYNGFDRHQFVKLVCRWADLTMPSSGVEQLSGVSASYLFDGHLSPSYNEDDGTGHETR